MSMFKKVKSLLYLLTVVRSNARNSRIKSLGETGGRAEILYFYYSREVR